MARDIAQISKRTSRYAQALGSSPELLEHLHEAAEEGLSLRDEVSAARVILGETMRMLGRATQAANGIMPQSIAQLALSQMREVNSLISSCAAIEAKRQDQQFDAAKMVLLLGRLRTDICLALKEHGMAEAVPFVQAAFGTAKWTGALDQAAVDEAMAAPASFDIKFRPIERDEAGKLLEHKQAFDSPEEALSNAKDLDLTSRSAKLQDKRASTAQPTSLASNLQKVEDESLKAELEQANNLLEQEIAAASEEGAPLPGVSEARTSKLKKEDVIDLPVARSLKKDVPT